MPVAQHTPALPVYLIHYDAPEWCLSAAKSVLASVGIHVQLTVVDNGPREVLPATAVAAFGARVISLPANVGYAGGANAAIEDWLSSADPAPYCAIASHDLHVEPTTLRDLVTAIDAHTRCAILGPVIRSPHAAAGGVWTGVRSFQVSPHDLGEGLAPERDWVSGSCMVLRREAVKDIGLLDARLGSYMEDVDYGLRARDHGWEVRVLSTASITGLGSASNQSIRFITTNTILVNTKRRGLKGLIHSLALFAWWTVRAAILSVAPWRSRERRHASRRYACQRAAGIRALLSDRRLRDFLSPHNDPVLVTR